MKFGDTAKSALRAECASRENLRRLRKLLWIVVQEQSTRGSILSLCFVSLLVATLLNRLLPIFYRLSHQLRSLQFLFHVLGSVERRRAQQVGRHQDLSAAVRARTNPDRRDGNRLRPFFRHGRGPRLQDHSERPALT